MYAYTLTFACCTTTCMTKCNGQTVKFATNVKEEEEEGKPVVPPPTEILEIRFSVLFFGIPFFHRDCFLLESKKIKEEPNLTTALSYIFTA